MNETETLAPEKLTSLRRIATNDHHIVDQNNGERHEAAFTGLIKDNGLLWEAELLPRSYGGNSWFGKFHPAAAQVLLRSLPAIVPAILRRKVNLKIAMLGHKIPKRDLEAVKKLYAKIEGREERVELNLYVSGYEDDPEPAPSEPGASSASTQADASTGEETAPADKSPTFPGPGEQPSTASSESESESS